MASPESLTVTAGDGIQVRIQIYANGEAAAPVALILPAMGVRASYYDVLAEELGRHGLHAVTADLRGHGESTVRAGRQCDFGYREIVREDLPAIGRAVRERFPQSLLIPVGHSLGGQMACLWAAVHPRDLDGIVLIASCSVYRRCWPFPVSVGMWFFFHVCRLLAVLVGHLPGRTIGFGGREARTLVKDWKHQGLTGRYEITGDEADYEALLRGVELPILTLSFSDDGYVTHRAVDHLAEKMPGVRREDRRMTPGDVGVDSIGHFAWARQPAIVSGLVADWIHAQGTGGEKF